MWSEQPLAPSAEDVITGLEFLVDLSMLSLVDQQDERKRNTLSMGGLINPRPWHGRCRAGYSNTGGPRLPRVRLVKKNILSLSAYNVLCDISSMILETCINCKICLIDPF